MDDEKISTVQIKSSTTEKKKKEAVNSIFQQAIFALAITRFLHVHEVPSTNLRKGGGWGTSPPLQVQSHTRAREERFCSWRYHLRLSTLHHINFTEQSQHINSYREKNTSQMFAKALVRRRTCSKKGYSTTSSSYEQTDNLVNCKEHPLFLRMELVKLLKWPTGEQTLMLTL